LKLNIEEIGESEKAKKFSGSYSHTYSRYLILLDNRVL
jgi:hypothetical protein